MSTSEKLVVFLSAVARTFASRQMIFYCENSIVMLPLTIRAVQRS